MARRIKKRNLVYCLIILSFIFGIFIKQIFIRNERNREISSVTAEWNNKGKPVIVRKIVKKNVNIYVKITASLAADQNYRAYVPKIIQEKLQPNQLIFLTDEEKNPIGKVVTVSEDIDVNTGMFLIKIALDPKALAGREKAIVYVNVKVLKNVICLPREIIAFDKKQNYVWTVKDNCAKKKVVIIGEHNGYGTVIKGGLSKSDWVVFKGYTILFEGDKVNVLQN
jgi:hypothetical protein